MLKIQDPRFDALIEEIINTNEFNNMKMHKHHFDSTVYDHTIKVAYLCYLHHQKHVRSKVNLNDLLRAALLHDYFLYDRRNKNSEEKINRLVHVFHHPKVALDNAQKDFDDLTKFEIDAIQRHMFPLTIIPPKTRCGWLICWYDKVAAIEDYFDYHNWAFLKQIS
jgi:uncharacterized protein